MCQGSSWRVSSMVWWYRSTLLSHRLGCLFSMGVLVSNAHLCTSGSTPGLLRYSVCRLSKSDMNCCASGEDTCSFSSATKLGWKPLLVKNGETPVISFVALL